MTAAWFDKRITRDKLDEMDQEFTRKYGKVKIVSIDEEEVAPHSDSDDIIDEESQVFDEEISDVIDYDEAAEDEEEK